MAWRPSKPFKRRGREKRRELDRSRRREDREELPEKRSRRNPKRYRDDDWKKLLDEDLWKS